MPIALATPTGSAPSGYNLITWAASPTNDNVTRYDIYRAPGLGATFASSSLIGSSTGTSYTDSTAAPGAAYTYFIKPINAIGGAAPSAGANLTTNTSSGGEFRLYGSIPDMPGASEELFDIELVGGEVFDAGFPLNVGGCLVAPTGAVSFVVKKNSTAVGSMNIAAGATGATWALASQFVGASGDRLKFYGPATQDPTLSGVSYTFRGRK